MACEERFRPPGASMGLVRPPEQSRNFVAAIRFPAPVSPFRRPHGFPKTRHPTPRCRELSWAQTPLRGQPRRPRRSPARLQLPSWGFAPLQRQQSGGPHFPGFPPRFVPPSGFPTLLTVSSLRTSRPRRPVPLMGFTLQSVSPPQSRSPFSAVALLLFLTSRHPALRTRRSRCPATPGRFSLRRSVLPRSRSPGKADALMGFTASPESFLARRGGGFPTPSLMPFRPPDSGRPAAWSSRASPNAQVDGLSRVRQLS